MQEIETLFKANPQIKHLMITGGGPTSHKIVLKDLIKVAKAYDLYITLETEGSEFIENVFIDLLSLSPKLSSSTPRAGSYIKEIDKIVTQNEVERHEKWRTNYTAMSLWIQCSVDTQVKFVVCSEEDLEEIQVIQSILNLENSRIWLMPEGFTNEELAKKRLWVERLCIENGYNYCERLHVVIHGDKRGV